MHPLLPGIATLLFLLTALAGCSNRNSDVRGTGLDPAPDAAVDPDAGSSDPPPAGDAGDGEARDAGPEPVPDAAASADAGPEEDAADAGIASVDAGSPDAGPPAPCPAEDLGDAMGLSVATGTTAGAPDAIAPSCGYGGGPEATFLWTAPAAGQYSFLTNGSDYDTVLSLRSGASCTGAELLCDDDGGEGVRSRVDVGLDAGDAVVIVVEGYGGDTGHFILSVYEDLPEEETSCTDGMDEDLDGDTDCDDYDCSSEPECTEIDCSDGVDDDGDGDVDCDDWDCSSEPECTETDCSDGVDDDGDGDVDCDDWDCYGEAACGESGMCTGGADDDGDGHADCADSECSCDAACLPADPCPDADLGTSTGSGVGSGSNVGRCSFRTGSCGGDGAGVAYRWTAPADGTYTIDTDGSDYDTVLYVLEGTCGGTELACDDDSGSGTQSLVTVTLSAGETVVIVVDAYSTYGRGDHLLNITGP